MELETQKDELKQRVAALLESPFASLMKHPKVIDLFYDVFQQRLCRNCKADRMFAHEKLTKFLIDGKREL